MRLFFARQGAGKPLVLLHGLFGSSNNFGPLASALGESFDVIRPDLRNHGRSPHDADAGIEAMASDLGDLLGALNLQRAFLLGHSLGGRVAMRFALDHPERVEKLVVADMAPREYAPLFPGLFEALMGLDLAGLQSRPEADQLLKEKIPEMALRAFLLSNLAKYPDGTFRWKMNLAALNAARPGMRSEIKAPEPFRGPALFLYGEDSDYVRSGDLPGIRALFPGAILEGIKAAGHWLHAERPAAFEASLRAFLRA